MADSKCSTVETLTPSLIDQKAKQLFLEVRASNKVAMTLYQKMGFNEMGVRKNYYPANNNREDAYLFAMEIV